MMKAEIIAAQDRNAPHASCLLPIKPWDGDMGDGSDIASRSKAWPRALPQEVDLRLCLCCMKSCLKYKLPTWVVGL